MSDDVERDDTDADRTSFTPGGTAGDRVARVRRIVERAEAKAKREVPPNTLRVAPLKRVVRPRW